MFDRIIVPFDGSEHSMHALETAIQISKKFASSITLIHAYMVPPPVTQKPVGMTGSLPYEITLPAEELTKLTKVIRGRGASILALGEEKAKAEGIQIEKVLIEGNAVEEILKTAKDGKFDLVVIGARGLSTIKEIFLGSVSHGVTIHAPCPVLITR